MNTVTDELKSRRRILRQEQRTQDGPVAAIHRRRKAAMIALLGRFEDLIEPLIPPGNEEAIDIFKGVCREKLNGLAYEGVRAAEGSPTDHVSDHTADLAERLAFHDTED